MTKLYHIKVVDDIYFSNKLYCIKEIRNLTNMGLRETKNLADIIADDYKSGSPSTPYQYIHIDTSVPGNINIINNLRERGVLIEDVDDRDSVLNNVLTIFEVLIPTKGIKYIVTDGSFEIDASRTLLEISIIEGIRVDDYQVNAIPIKLDISNKLVSLPFSECIIEQPI